MEKQTSSLPPPPPPPPHTHTHTDCSRNWVLILDGVKISWEEEGFQFGFKGQAQGLGWFLTRLPLKFADNNEVGEIVIWGL